MAASQIVGFSKEVFRPLQVRFAMQVGGEERFLRKKKFLTTKKWDIIFAKTLLNSHRLADSEIFLLL
jgi:hypothetical protein